MDKPPILGMIERGDQVVLRVLENVQQSTIKPIIEKFIKSGSLVNTGEYDIYGRLAEWGYEHKRSVIVMASMRGTKTGMAFTKFM